MAKKTQTSRKRAAAAKRSALLSRRALAEQLGVSAMTITRWEQDGCPVARRSGRGMATLFDPAAVAAWRAQVAATRDAAGALSLADERARLAIRQRERIEMQLRRDRGELLSRDLVERDGKAFVRAWAAKVRGLPRRLVNAGVVAREQEAAAKTVCLAMLTDISTWRTAADCEAAATSEDAMTHPGGA